MLAGHSFNANANCKVAKGIHKNSSSDNSPERDHSSSENEFFYFGDED